MPRRCRFIREESGVVAPMAILLMLSLLGFCALVLDVGLIYAERRALQNAADAAALAGARELQRNLLGAPSDPLFEAEVLAAYNGVPTGYGDCAADGRASLGVNRDGPLPHSWEVSSSRLVTLQFGRAVGVPSMCVRARAVAVVTEIQPAKIWPWALLKGSPADEGTFEWLLAQFGYGTQFTLKEGADGSSQGNFGIVDFLTTCGEGASQYEWWIYNGFGTRAGEAVPVRVPPGEWSICTETGNKANVNKDYAIYVEAQQSIDCPYGDDVRCPLVGMIPIVRGTSWPSGSSKPVTIVDFAVFQIDRVAVGGGTGHMEIEGHFLHYAGGVGPTWAPDPSGSLSGLIGVRLWQ